MLVPAVHLLIKISRFQSHFSFSALQRDGEHYSVQKTAFKKKKEEKKVYTRCNSDAYRKQSIQDIRKSNTTRSPHLAI